MKKKIIGLLVAGFCLVAAISPAFAAKNSTILFIPHDDRPVSFAQTADTVRQLDYTLLSPPQALLGNRQNWGEPDGLWQWLFENVKQADAVVLSSDALLYGSLVGSRKHAFSEATIAERARRFSQLRQENPRLKIYVFGSIMRTPRSGEASGTEEPSYYARYGADIFQLTALTDKSETEGLSRSERRQLTRLGKSIPQEALLDWMSRRDKNFGANLQLIDAMRQGAFSYLALGRDDNAPFSQTHKESRLLDARSGDLGVSKFQTLSGIDEIGMILLTRAVNDLEWNIPLVSVHYADGVGAKTVPSYSDEEIGTAIRSHLFAAGAIPVPTVKRADLVLMVNTKVDGTTSEANFPDNTAHPHENTKSFVDAAAQYLSEGHRVSIADIAFGNGADNALMAELERRSLLASLASYAGWNTANNSAGFAIGQGILSAHMTEAERKHLLAVRYLDDWAYQANIRQAVAGEPQTMKGGSYGQLDKAKRKVVKSARDKMRIFSETHLEQFPMRSIKIDFPWNRMFETSVEIQ